MVDRNHDALASINCYTLRCPSIIDIKLDNAVSIAILNIYNLRLDTFVTTKYCERLHVTIIDFTHFEKPTAQKKYLGYPI